MFLAMVSFKGYGVGILPQPLSVSYGKGSFSLGQQVVLLSPGRLANERRALEEMLLGEFGLVLGKPAVRNGIIVLSFERRLQAELGLEGYQIVVAGDSVVISSAGSAGIFYGIQSLRQLIKKNSDGGLTVPQVTIKDRPRFAKRIFMLDEGRHFKGMQVVKSVLDEMAVLKMNTFHWHLTEDQGWRIQIKKYPLLTSVGGFRDSTESSGWGAKVKTFKRERHGGFYKQEEIREIVAYAAARHIEIIPEIDMPGHSTAAIAAYPWLSASGQQIPVAANWGVLPNAYNVADPKVMGFLKDVLSEVMDLFPSKIIHIGGDEVDYSSWKNSAMVTGFMSDKKLSSPAELQMWFTGEIAGFLSARGRTQMGWNDIMGKKLLDHFNTDSADYKVGLKLAPEAIVHFWLGDKTMMVDAIRGGHQVVNAFHKNTYFNYGYDQISLAQAYGFEPVPAGLSSAESSLVLGVSCQLWSEYVSDVETMNYQLFPRLAANAEVGWTAAGNKDYSSFTSRLNYFLSRWKDKGIIYSPVDNMNEQKK
ncbi:beta-N-acetylhexosaminidase [Pedobacter sp. UC225_61]|uniref:beta-N-acetylhexosaminidase n=1 Tax=Pedobacter sp. UC225_61 TaxID=3374623 RepID=UPI0037A6F4BF